MSSTEFRNQLLRALPARDLQHLALHLESVHLEQGQQLGRAGELADHVYFPESALGSVVIKSGNHSMEGLMFGCDGMSSTALLVDDHSPFSCVTRLSGAASRVATGSFKEFLQTHPYSVRIFRRYAKTECVQMGFTVVATGRAKLEQRVARWLAMACDRSLTDTLATTQENLAELFGVRRPSVTDCLHTLEGHRMIQGSRGMIRITDQKALAGFAGSHYGEAEREYTRIMGFAPGSSLPPKALSARD